MPTHRWGDYTPSGHLGRILDDKTPQLGGMLDGNGFTFNGAVAFEAQAGEALSKGNAVYVSGVSGNKPVVMKADADDAAKMPAFGIAETDANNNANVNVVTFGTVYEIDTSAYSAGDELYVSTTAGELTATKPTGATAKLQNIGKVIRSHASAGSIKVGGAGRTNAVPNLDDGTVFIGDSNNQAEQRALVMADLSEYTFTDDIAIEKNEAKVIFGESGGTYGGPHGLDFYDADGTLRWGFYYRTTPETLTWELSGTTAKLTLDTTGNLTATGTVTASGGDSDDWNTAYSWGDHASAGYATSFDSLSSKTGGTGNYRTSGQIQCGTSGSGMVALTVNDGGGNANVTFNDASNGPDHAGYNRGRIHVNVDSTSNATMTLEVGSGGSAPNSGFVIRESGVTTPGTVDAAGGTFTGKLLISVASQATDLLRVASTTGYGYMSVSGISGSDAGLIFQEGTSNRCMLGHDQSADTFRVYWYNNTNGSAINSNRLTLTSSGNLTVTGTVSATGGNSTNWNTAYGWGNHASAGYLTFDGTGYNTYTTTADWNANFIGTSVGVTCRKTGWSYAGNANLTDAGNYTETAGSSFIKWSDGSRNTVLVIAPTTGGSANRVMIYNNQGSGYSPGWREIHTDKQGCVAPWFQPSGAGQLRDVTGNYGSIEVDGSATGGWEGYSIGGRAVFMHNNNTGTGIYNDVNNEWLFYGVHNAATYMYYNGSSKVYTYSSGGRVTGNLLATSDVYAYYSDERLKDKTGKIENALDKVDAIETFYYTHNDTANELGYEGKEQQVGVSAQSVAAVMPEVVHLAPIDDDGEGNSITGENYQTVNYQRLVPLLLEAIKELRTEVEELKGDR